MYLIQLHLIRQSKYNTSFVLVCINSKVELLQLQCAPPSAFMVFQGLFDLYEVCNHLPLVFCPFPRDGTYGAYVRAVQMTISPSAGYAGW